MRCGILLLMIASLSQAGEADVDRAVSAGKEYEANRAKFTAWTIEFKFTVAKAKSLDDAIARRWSDESVGKGYSSYDGKHGRFEIVHSLKDMVAKRIELEPRHFQSHLYSARYLTDGEVTLIDHMSPARTEKEMRHVVQIHPGADLFRQHVHLPLRLGQGELGQNNTLGHQARWAQRGTGRRLDVHEGVDLRGMNLVEFTFTGPDDKANDKAVDFIYWVDFKHGAIPRQTLTVYPAPEGGTGRDYMILDDLRDVGDGAWFPYRQLRYDERAHLVQERVITKADFTMPLDPSSFQLTFKKPIRVVDTVRHVVYPRGTTWDLTRLPRPERSWGAPLPLGLKSDAKAKPPAREVAPPVKPGECPVDGE